jgi:hypothetical protein
MTETSSVPLEGLEFKVYSLYGHPYLPKGLKFKAGNFGRDERPARPRMTGVVIRTSESASTSWGFFDKLLLERGQKP